MRPLDPVAVPLEGTNLVEASAGTGKTRTITTLYVRLLTEAELPVGQILVVTFTNAATAELRDRVRQRVREALAAVETGTETGDEALDRWVRWRRDQGRAPTDSRRLRQALRGFDDAAIFTIHGFCQRVLQENAFESGAPFDAEMIGDVGLLIDEVVRDFWARELYAEQPLLLRSLGERKINPTSLAELVKLALANPGAALVPAPAVADIDGAMAARRAALARAAEVWRLERDAVLAMLAEHEALDHNKYRSTSVRGRWAADMDECLLSASGAAAAELPKSFEKFTTVGIRGGIRKNRVAPTHRLFEACDQVVAAQGELDGALDARRLRLQRETVDYARREVRRRLDAAHEQSFDELVRRVSDALADARGGVELAGAVRRRYKAALIDEFQDTDPIQYSIFRRLFHEGGGRLFVVGDPKQAIYSFRGADVFIYRDARGDAAERVHNLGVNRRSDPRLIEAVNAIFTEAPAPFVFNWLAFTPAEAPKEARDQLAAAGQAVAPLRLLFVSRDHRALTRDGRLVKNPVRAEIARAIAAQIAAAVGGRLTIAGRAVRASDIAVLCRTNDEGRLVQQELRAAGIPSALQSESSVFETPEAEEMGRLLRAAAEPGDGNLMRAALVTTLVGASGGEVAELLRDELKWDEWVRRFQSWNDTWLRRGFVAAFQQVIEELEVPARLLALRDGERRLTNVLHVAELLQNAIVEAHQGPLAAVEWLARMRDDAPARAELGSEAAQIRLENDADAVQISTVHKSKGLEYPIVFCPFLWDGNLRRRADLAFSRFHDPGNRDALTFDLSADRTGGNGLLADREALAESLRVTYVALTRAKHLCAVVCGAFSEAERSPLAYVLHHLGNPGAGATDSPWSSAAVDRFTRIDDRAMRDDLETLARVSGGAIEVVDLRTGVHPPAPPAPEPLPPLAARKPARSLALDWRTSSFSGLVADSERHGLPLVEEADRDAASEGSVVPTIEEVSDDLVPLREFPTGTRAGTLIHSIFEQIDFQIEDDAARRAQIGEILCRYGFEARWAEALTRAVADTVGAPLGEGAPPPSLRRIPPDKRLCELEFVFPVGRDVSERSGVQEAEESHQGKSGDAANGSCLLTPGRLADVFLQRATAAWRADYAGRVRALGFAPLAGFLRGFIDLVFEHAGRWYVVDYKSNWLGARYGDYNSKRLREAMLRHHYILQYHLYVVAVHKYLRRRLAGYDYDRHFGGVAYAFVRGIGPAGGGVTGVYRDRPPAALIEALAGLLEAPGGDGGGA